MRGDEHHQEPDGRYRGGPYTTNDLPGCPDGGLLLGTDKADKLDGKKGDDEIRGLGAADFIYGGVGNDVIYAGPGDEASLFGDEGDDVIYGGHGDDGIEEGKGADVIFVSGGTDSSLGALALCGARKVPCFSTSYDNRSVAPSAGRSSSRL